MLWRLNVNQISKTLQKHRECNGNMRIMVILDFMARQAIHGNFGLHKIPFRDYELLVRAMDCFLKSWKLVS